MQLTHVINWVLWGLVRAFTPRRIQSQVFTGAVVFSVIAACLYPFGSAGAKCIDYGEYLHLVGSVDTPGHAYGVAISCSYAYVADWESGLHVIDVSTPSSPQLVCSVDTPDCACGVAISGSYAYVAGHNSGLLVIDISSPFNPQLVGSLSIPGSAWGVVISGSYAYIAGEDSGLHVINISNPFNPQLVGSVDTPDYAYSVAVSGSCACVADFRSLQVIDISNPSSPQILGSVDTTPDSAYGVAISGSYAYVGNTPCFQVIDISSPSSPQLVGNLDTPDGARGVAISDSYAYVAGKGSGLHVINISNPYSPQLVDSVDTPGIACGVAISGGFVYVADWESGLQLIGLPQFCLSTPDPQIPQPPKITPCEMPLEWEYSGQTPSSWRISMSFDGGAHFRVLDVIDDPSGTVRSTTLDIPPVSTLEARIRIEAFGIGGNLLGSDATEWNLVLQNRYRIYFDAPWKDETGQQVRDVGIVILWDPVQGAARYEVEVDDTGGFDDLTPTFCGDWDKKTYPPMLPDPISGILPTVWSPPDEDLAKMPAARYKATVKAKDAGGSTLQTYEGQFTLCRLGDFRPLDTDRDLKPVVLVHGWTSDSSTWFDDENRSPLIDGLIGNAGPDDFRPWTFEYPNIDFVSLSGTGLSEAICYVLALSSCDQVDIVAHSMGGLVSRAYLQSRLDVIDEIGATPESYRGDVRRLVTLSSPHLGVKDLQVFIGSANKASNPFAFCDNLIQLSGSVLDLPDDSDYIRLLAESALPAGTEYFFAAGSRPSGEFLGSARYEVQVTSCPSGGDATVSACSASGGLCPSKLKLNGTDLLSGKTAVRRFYELGHGLMSKPGVDPGNSETGALLDDVLDFLRLGVTSLSPESCPDSPAREWILRAIYADADIIYLKGGEACARETDELSVATLAGQESVPIPGATVKVRDISGTDPESGVLYVAGRDGTVAPLLGAGDYELTIAAKGHRPRMEQIHLQGDESNAVWTVDLEEDQAYAGPRNPAFLINGGASATNDTMVSLSLTCDNASEYQVGTNDSFRGATWLPMAPAASMSIGSDPGTKVLYARFRSASGDTTEAIPSMIALTSEWGSLTVTASEPAVGFYLDGMRISRPTPAFLDSVPPGFHQVALDAPGMIVDPPSMMVDVDAGTNASADFNVIAALPPPPVDLVSLGPGSYMTGDPLRWNRPAALPDYTDLRYDLLVSSDSTFGQAVLSRIGIVDTTFSLRSHLPDSMAYYVAVNSVNGYGLSSASTPESRRILLDYTPPSLGILQPSPGDTLPTGETTTLVTAAADWSGIESFWAVISPDGGGSYPDTLWSGEWAAELEVQVPGYGLADSCLVVIAAADLAGNVGVAESDFFFVISDGVTAVPGEPGSSRFRMAMLNGNPLPSVSRIALEIPGGGHTQVAVYDLRGRRVCVLLDGPVPSGSRIITWDGKDDAGHRLAAGVYFLRAQSGTKTLVRKIAIVR